jgi:transcription termination factor 2
MGVEDTSPVLIPLWPGFSYKEHQTVGINWMLQREIPAKDDSPRGGILADEMGLGKTIQMAGLLLNGHQRIGTQNLLVVPVAVISQWKSVLEKAGMGVLVPERGRASWGWRTDVKARSPLMPAVHIIGYEALARRSGLGRLYKWDRVIYDEAHRLAGEKIGGLARLLNTEVTWLLTATPIINSEKDFVRLLEVLGVKDVPSTAASSPFLIKKYMMARSMEQMRGIIADAPAAPQFETVLLDFLTGEEADFYRGMTGMITRRWLALEQDQMAGAALEKLKMFMRLRQLSLHPQVYIEARKSQFKRLYTRPDWVGSSTKFEAIRGLVGGKVGTTTTATVGGKVGTTTTTATPHRWIIFCHFRKEMELLRDLLAAEQNVARVQIYSGDLTAAEKERVVAATHKPLAANKSEVLLVQLQSGGTGLNLQHFDRIIFTGPWWTKALMDQAVGRAVRIGQKSQVVVYNVVLKEEEALNIDKYMAEKASQKGQLCAQVLGMARRDIGDSKAANKIQV